jgi:hypothetical protein
MKKFLIISSFLLLLGVLATVITFVLISRYKSEVVPVVSDAIEEVSSLPASINTPELPPAIEAVMGEGEGVELKDIPLTEAQEKVLSVVNIDTETFVITEAKVACAVEMVGEERVLAIMAGDAPSVLEVAKLTPCLGQ